MDDGGDGGVDSPVGGGGGVGGVLHRRRGVSWKESDGCKLMHTPPALRQVREILVKILSTLREVMSTCDILVVKRSYRKQGKWLVIKWFMRSTM